MLEKAVRLGFITFAGRPEDLPFTKFFLARWAEEDLKPLPANFADDLKKIYQTNLYGAEANTETQIIKPVFKALAFDCDPLEKVDLEGIGSPDQVYYDSPENAQKRAFEGLLTIVEAKGWDIDLKIREEKQLRTYLDLAYARSQNEIKWGILTNGKLWRLYRAGKRSYIQFNLEKLEAQFDDLSLFSENDKVRPFARTLFYALFSHKTFADKLLDQIERKAKEHQQSIEEDLHKQAYPALIAIFNGFLEATQRRFAKSAQYLKVQQEEARQNAYENSVYFLYRLLFLMYAKGRELKFYEKLPPEYRRIFDEAVKNAPIEYENNALIFAEEKGIFGKDTHSNFSAKLIEIFKWLDQGNPRKKIPEYNGNLFKDREIDFFQVSDYHAGMALRLLAFSPEGVSFDYGSLEVQHLGNIYERLLLFDVRQQGKKYDFYYKGMIGKGEKITLKFPENWSYFDVDPSQRKSTGTYYTPDYIVEYILEQTIGKKLQEIKSDMLDQILSLKILDPAMGSGHFLVRATEYLAKFIYDNIGEVKLTEPQKNIVSKGFGDITNAVRKLLGDWTNFDSLHQKLTDPKTHFWDRVIVKRCIYGVDMNPVAVELSKLSLWLHTLSEGEPIQFLDHHIKCGNSLIGAWEIGDFILPESERYREFSQAVKLMSLVAENRDANIEEVRESQQLYQTAYKLLTPFRLRMDVALAAHHFMKFEKEIEKDAIARLEEAVVKYEEEGEKRQIEDSKEEPTPSPKSMISTLFNPQKIEVAKAEQPKTELESRLEEALELAKNRHFFHWKLKFPEVWYRSDLPQGDAERENGGFDVVVGNPPYVRQESLGQQFKSYSKEKFTTYAGTADLYVYFIEQAHRLLRADGNFGMITSNKFMRANYGKNIRELLSTKTTLHQIVDFGELPVFSLAATFPSITLTKNQTTKNQRFIYAPVKRLDFDDLEEEVDLVGSELDDSSLSGFNWNLVGRNENLLIEKLKQKSTTLNIYVNKEIYRGVVTGCNEAFLIDIETKNKLIAEDSKSKSIIKPFVNGDDVRNYQIHFQKMYLIFTRRDTNIEKFPAIQQYLANFKERLTPKPKGWKGEWKGRKPGSYKWYEIQDITAYHNEFEKTKIAWPEIAKESRFAIDSENLFLNKTCFFTPRNDFYLLGVLNSKLIWFFLKNICSVLGDADKGGRLLLQKIYVERIPIRRISFVTPESERQAEFENLKSAYSDLPCLKELANLLDKSADLLAYKWSPDPEKVAAHNQKEINKDFQISEGDTWERSDVVHDFLAYLAEKMSEYARYQSILERFAAGKIESKSVEEAEAHDIFDEHNRSYKKKEARQLANFYGDKFSGTDNLIDKIVYQLYDLTEEEIKIIEV